MADRASRDRLKRKKQRSRVVRVNDPGNDDTTVAQLQSADVALDTRLDTLETAFRVKGTTTGTQAIATGVPEFIDFDGADDFDFTGWHDAGSGTLSVRESFTVPTGAGGVYQLVAHVEWAATAATTVFAVEITVGGAPITERLDMHEVLAGDVWSAQLCATLSLSATNALKVQVTQTGAASLNVVNATFSIVRASP